MIKGVSEAFPWKLVPFSGGYYQCVSYSNPISSLDIRSHPSSSIETLDGKYIWRMTGGRDYDPVIHILSARKTSDDPFG